MRIGVVCYPSFGGSGVIAVELAIGLAKRGHSVHVIASAPTGRALPPEVRFHQVSVPKYPLFEHPPYELALASKIAQVSREHQLDLINVHYAIPHAASAHLARQVIGPNAPALVTTLHGTDVTRAGDDPSFAAVTSFAVARSDGVTVPSRFLEEAATELLGAIPIEIIPNFVDIDRFVPAPSRDPILFHVSNFRPIKRPLDLIEILATVRRTMPARLVMVGDGPERRRTEDRVRALGLEESVEFLGMQADFADRLARACAFILTSELESFGLAALEAMSAGVPVLAYGVGGLPEVVLDGVTGRLVEPFDREALARAAVELLLSPELTVRFGRAARRRVLEHFRAEPAIDRYEEFFHRVVEARSTRRT